MAEVAFLVTAFRAELPLALRALDQTVAAGVLLAAGAGAHAAGAVRFVAVFAVDVARLAEGYTAAVAIEAVAGLDHAAAILAGHAFPVVEFDVSAPPAVVVQDLRHQIEEVQ